MDSTRTLSESMGLGDAIARTRRSSLVLEKYISQIEQVIKDEGLTCWVSLNEETVTTIRPAHTGSDEKRTTRQRVVGLFFGMDDQERCRVQVQIRSNEDFAAHFDVTVNELDIDAADFMYGASSHKNEYRMAPNRHGERNKCLDAIRNACRKPLRVDQ